MKRYNTVRYDSATKVNHSMSAKEIGIYYEQVAEADVAHLRVTRPKYKGYNEFGRTSAERSNNAPKT